MCYWHSPFFYRRLTYFHTLIIFVEVILGVLRLKLFLTPASSNSRFFPSRNMTVNVQETDDNQIVKGFSIDWVSCLPATLLSLFIILTIFLAVFAKILACCSTCKDKIEVLCEPTEIIDDVRSWWKTRSVHRFIQLNCNCPCYRTRPRLRFQVRLIYLSVCIILRVIAISFYISAANNNLGLDLAVICGFSILSLAMIFPLELYYYCVWWYYRPSCDKEYSGFSKKHRRYIPYHLTGDERTKSLGNRLCKEGDQCSNHTLEHIMIYHPSFHNPLARFVDLPEAASENGRYIGFHQTSVQAAVCIAHSDFNISTNRYTTLLGHGIYFARSIEGTRGKANQAGAFICAEVNMGRVKRVDRNSYSGAYQGNNNWWKKYDTIYYCHDNDERDEFCVKSPDQILQWVIFIEDRHDRKVKRFRLDREFDEASCGCI